MAGNPDPAAWFRCLDAAPPLGVRTSGVVRGERTRLDRTDLLGHCITTQLAE